MRCWFDEKDLLPGERIADKIDEGIESNDCIVLVCSESALTSWWVDKEIEKALRRDREEWKAGRRTMRLIPITIDDFVFERWESGKKDSVLELSIGDFRNWRVKGSYESSLEKLLTALRSQ